MRRRFRQKIEFHDVRFEVDSGEDYSNLGIVTVTLENADKLIASLDELAGFKIDTCRFAMSEVEAVVDGLRVVVFNTKAGQFCAMIEAMGAACLFQRQ